MKSLLILPVVLSSVFAASPGAGADADAAIREAIVAAVRARMGDHAEVSVEEVRVQGEWTRADVHARLAPGVRLGRPMRVALGAPGRPGAAIAWIGAADAVVHVSVDHLHARRPVARGDVLTESDVTLVRHPVEGALRAWPAADAAGRTRALRDMAAGACLGPGTVALLPLVRAGQDVQASVRVGQVVAEASLVAADGGEMGAIIRVVNPQSRRSLRARVTGPGIVEVIP